MQNYTCIQVISEPKGLPVFRDDMLMSNPIIVSAVHLTGVTFIVKAIRKDYYLWNLFL